LADVVDDAEQGNGFCVQFFSIWFDEGVTVLERLNQSADTLDESGNTGGDP
jgi:hypothetical protein